MKILLVCAGGLSTGILMQKLKNYWKEQNIDLEIEAAGMAECQQASRGFDMVLVGPQIAYHLKDIQESTGLPCQAIASNDYALGKCENILKQVQAMEKEIKEKKKA